MIHVDETIASEPTTDDIASLRKACGVLERFVRQTDQRQTVITYLLAVRAELIDRTMIATARSKPISAQRA